MQYIAHILVVASLYTCLSMSLDLVAGHARLVSVGHVAFYAAGAYTYAILGTRHGLSMAVCLPIAGLLGGLLSLAVSIPTSRLRGDYFAIATLAFHLVMQSILMNWEAVTGGVFGIRGVSSLALSNLHLDHPLAHVGLAAALAALTWWVVQRFSRGSYGRILHALREDEVMAASLGTDVPAIRRTVIAVSSALAAIAGVEFAAYLSYIDPSSFPLLDSILVLAMVFLGGAASRFGPLIGAVALATIPEGLRFLGLPPAMVGDVRQILFGGALVAIMLWRPRGLFGDRGVGL